MDRRPVSSFATLEEGPPARVLREEEERVLEVAALAPRGERGLKAELLGGVGSRLHGTGGLEHVQGDPEGIGAHRQILQLAGGVIALGVQAGLLGIEAAVEAAALVELERVQGVCLPLLGTLAAAELDGVFDGLGPRPQGNPVAQVEDGLAAGNAGQGVHEDFQGADHLQHLGVGLFRVGRIELLGEQARSFFGVVLELLEDVRPFTTGQELPGRDPARGLGEGFPEGLAVGGERQEDPGGAVVGRHHHLVFGAQALLQHVGQLDEGVAAPLDPEAVLVDEDHEAEPGGAFRPRRGDLPGPCPYCGRRRRYGCALFDTAEVAELDRLAVLEDLEVGAREVRHRPALPVRGIDLEVDHLDVHRGRESRRRLLCGQ